MDLSTAFDSILAILLIILSIGIRRFYVLVDQLRREDATLHDRITKVATSYAQKHDLEKMEERIISRIDTFEEACGSCRRGWGK